MGDTMLDTEQMTALIETYLIPWGINIAMAILVFVIGRWVVKALMALFGKLMERANYDNMLVDFAKSILNAVLMLFVIVASLDQLGVDTTSLVALLGAAGLAIGLSMKDSLSNFAAGVMLLMFRPFKTGDYVEAAGTAGSVKSIGIFTSTIMTPDNKMTIVPNGAIYGSNITNYSAMETRRVDMVVGISYGSDLLKAKQILEALTKEDERILTEPAPVVAVSELADSSVNFVVRPWVKSPDFWAVKWDFTEKVKLRFDAEGIEIPFPQMDVHVHKEGE
ncbi:mechanosensitive ion channel [Aliiglaciecola sp. CAU 1673]|uniref:mechanosensitive ion channel family protein n=1 Tax=Aliiglaciecola sp. CAU 1673 TaxID=3032595 RepID=UPI0023D9A265|nr:mechanosensitive ion channel domain-containing protein [Aliiglaciecola sp. CAU 1673]MDF2179479.1 mechanosensitive ion channel [Aliiglaciecola sp. CAU 1673]